MRETTIKHVNDYQWDIKIVENKALNLARKEHPEHGGEAFCISLLREDNGQKEHQSSSWIRTEQIPALIKALTEIWFDADHQTVDNPQQ